jgi:DNA repair photolyase
LYELSPTHVFIHERIREQPIWRERAERICSGLGEAGRAPMWFGDDNIPDLAAEHNWAGARRRMGHFAELDDPDVLLNVFAFDDSHRERMRAIAERCPEGARGLVPAVMGRDAFVFFDAMLPTDESRHDKVCRPAWRIHMAQGCPHRCVYCGFGHLMPCMVNVEEYVDELHKVVEAHPWQQVYLYEDDAEALALEPQLGAMKALTEYFATRPNEYVLVHSKSANVDHLLDLDHGGHTIMLWSLTSHTVSREFEAGSGTTEERIDAARKCQEAGMPVRFKLKPIVPVANWRDECREMIRLLFEQTQPDVISMFTLAWMTYEDLRAVFDTSKLDPAYVKAAEASVEKVKDTRTKPFPHWVRAEIYDFCLTEIRRWDAEIPVSLSTETWEMWREFGERLGQRPDNYMCGCGPQAVPGARKLCVVPWVVARNALPLADTQ